MTREPPRSMIPSLSLALFVQRLAFDSAAAKEPPFLFREIGARVNRAAVIPHQEIAALPDVLEDELAPLADLVELLQNGFALLLAHLLDACRHQAIDEQRFASGVGMGDEDRVIPVRNAAEVA